MDDIRMVRELFGETPPDPQLQTRIRAQLAGAVRPMRRRGFPRNRAGLGLGLVAAAAATTVGIATVGGGPGGDSPSAKPSPLSARTILLAAAQQAERTPVGRYWYSNQIQGQSYVMRPKTGTYAITGAHSETFQWSGAKKGLGYAFYGRDLPAKPLTPADEAVWQKAGSPSSFRVWSNDHYYTYKSKATKWEIDDPDANGGGKFSLDGTRRELTVEQLQNLPTDPVKLAKLFFEPRRIPGVRLPGGRKVKPRMTDALDASGKVLQTESILEDAPIPPKVRAGLMRALAAQPGVRTIESATDPLGRKGVALVADDKPTRVTAEFGTPPEERGVYGSRQEIIFDKATGRLLGEQRVLVKPGGPYRAQPSGFVINYWLVRDSQWTDTKPRPPEELPF